MDDGTTRSCHIQDGNTAGLFVNGSNTTNISMGVRDLGANNGYSYEGFVASLDSDGFTVTWDRLSTPTGTLIITYAAFA